MQTQVIVLRRTFCSTGSLLEVAMIFATPQIDGIRKKPTPAYRQQAIREYQETQVIMGLLS